MRALVTGATGFLGGRLARMLAAAGRDVVATGRNPEAGQRLESPGITFRTVDLTSPEQLRALPPCELVFHCAALSSAWGPMAAFRRANVDATRNLLDYCRRAGTRRLVHISTPSIYFDFRDRTDVAEDAPLPRRFVNAYAASKYAAECLLNDAARDGAGPQVAILRPRGIFGVGDTALMPRLERVARRGRFPLLRGGRALVDITHVDNVAHAAMLAADAPLAAPAACYNITNGEPCAIGDILSAVLRPLFPGCRFTPLPYPPLHGAARLMETGARLLRLGEPPLTAYGVGLMAFSQTLDISRARRDLGYSPPVPLQEGIDRYVHARGRG